MLQVIQGDGAAVDIGLQVLEHLGELAGGGRQGTQALLLLLRGPAARCIAPGQRCSVVPHLGHERSGLGQLHVAVGQFTDGHLGGHGPAEQLSAQLSQ